jgi:hypothetical protein
MQALSGNNTRSRLPKMKNKLYAKKTTKILKANLKQEI